MMKKILSLLLALCMMLSCAVLLSACDKKEENPQKSGGGDVTYKNYQSGRVFYKVPSDWMEITNSGTGQASYVKASAEETKTLTIAGGLQLGEAESVAMGFKRGVATMIVDKLIESTEEYETADERKEMIENTLRTLVMTDELFLEFLLWNQRNETAASVAIEDVEILEMNDRCLLFVMIGKGEFSEQTIYEYCYMFSTPTASFTNDEGETYSYYWGMSVGLACNGRDDALLRTIVNSITFGSVEASDFENAEPNE